MLSYSIILIMTHTLTPQSVHKTMLSCCQFQAAQTGSLFRAKLLGSLISKTGEQIKQHHNHYIYIYCMYVHMKMGLTNNQRFSIFGWQQKYEC